MKKLLCFILLSFVCTISCIKFSTVQMSNNGPIPTGGGCSREISSNSFLHFGGGIEYSVPTDGNDTFSNQLWKFTYNKQHNSGYWELLQPTGHVPSARSFCSMDVITDSSNNKYACVVGGTTFQGRVFGQISQDYFICYDIARNNWIDYSYIPDGPGPRAGTIARSLNGKLYVASGVRPVPPPFFFEFLNDLYVFDFCTMSWTQLATGPFYPRYDSRGEILKVNENDWRFVITAGETLLPTFELGYVGDTWEYIINSGTWQFITDEEPEPINQGPCMVKSKNSKKITTYGGDQVGFSENCEVQNIPKNIGNKVWEFQVETGNWALRPVTGNSLIPKKIKRHECIRLDEDILAFGGWELFCPTNSTHVQSHFLEMYRIR